MLFTNGAAATIITKGLGAPACCAIITAPFGVVCACEVVPPTPGQPGSGGSTPVYLPPLFTPIGQKLDTDTRLVMITVKTREHQWKRMYVVDKRKADVIVAVINFVNVVKEKTAIAVENLKQATLKVIATFRDK